MILGIISNRGMLVVAAVIGLLSQTGIFDFDPDDWSQADLERYGWILGAIQSALENGNVFLMALLVIVGIVVLVILMRFLSIAWAVAKFYGFTLTQRGDDLRAEYGLLTKVSATLPSHRIQLLSTRMSRLHRWFHRRSVQVQTAGGSAGGEQADATRTQWLAPVMPSADVPGLVREVWPEVDLDAVSWTPIEPRSWKRLFRRGLLWVLPLSVVGLLALFPWRPWGLLIGIPALAMAYIHARRWVAATGYALIPGAILFKSGWWGTSTSIVRFSKIQALSLNQTPFDRRHAMATLSVDTAGAGGGTHRIDIPFLDSEIASGIVDTLYEEASRTAFRW